MKTNTTFQDITDGVSRIGDDEDTPLIKEGTPEATAGRFGQATHDGTIQSLPGVKGCSSYP